MNDRMRTKINCKLPDIIFIYKHFLSSRGCLLIYLRSSK
jgi:hypothetical protein